MRSFFNNLIFLLLFACFAGAFYFYIPPSVKDLHKRINQPTSIASNAERLSLIQEYENLLAKNLPENNPALYFYWFSNQRKISDLRVKKAIEEIKNTKINPNEIKVWSLLNMGVVIKTNGKTIAIDTANLPFSQAHNELVDTVDAFVVTHMDGDHYDPTLLKKALSRNKKVIFPEGIPLLGGSSNSIAVASGTSENVGEVKITAYQTDHRGDGNFNEPNAWFIIEVDGFKLLHTGDGRDFKNKEESQKVYAMKDFDILLGNSNTNSTLHPYNIRDLKPKVLIPLHLFKFMSGNDLYQESTIEAISKKYEQYTKDLQGIEKIYLLPGESFVYTK